MTYQHRMTESTTLAYYPGAYGPTIRINTRALEELKAVRGLFGRLASGDIVQADASRVLACGTDSIQALMVQASPEPQAKALELKGNGPQGPIFSWTAAGLKGPQASSQESDGSESRPILLAKRSK